MSLSRQNYVRLVMIWIGMSNTILGSFKNWMESRKHLYEGITTGYVDQESGTWWPGTDFCRIDYEDLLKEIDLFSEQFKSK